jgi:hypothetical protein
VACSPCFFPLFNRGATHRYIRGTLDQRKKGRSPFALNYCKKKNVQFFKKKNNNNNVEPPVQKSIRVEPEDKQE